MNEARQQVLYDKKWKRFLGKTWLFRFVPFVEFVLAAGSLATGNVRDESDFDVIIGVRKGRIFTARFFSILAFGLLGWRRKKLSHDEEAKDKVCLNHFVTEASHRLSPPHSPYWKALYTNLVPVYGAPAAIQAFFDANAEWMRGRVVLSDDLRYRHRAPSLVKRAKERFFGGALGNWLEWSLKRMQITKIERSLKKDAPGYKPRIIYTDTELEFHPDTRRIELLEESL